MVDYYHLIRPILDRLPPETAHNLGIRSLRLASKLGLLPSQQRKDDPTLVCRLWGRDFANPIGLAAGLDKNAKALNELLSLGFGFVEVGAITPRPQKGNAKPRLFRLAEDKALINHFGFPNEGLERICAQLQHRLRMQIRSPGIVGANVGVNRDTEETRIEELIISDYVKSIKRLCNLVDYLVINVSCPNTPGLRKLQERKSLARLTAKALAARAEVSGIARPPLLLKIDPDLQSHVKEDIANIAISCGIDGLIISNTTVGRPNTLKSRHKNQIGGLSGRPLFARSTEVLREMYRLTEGRIPLIGLGGVASGRDAYTKVRAGASLVQLYTALVYEGPSLVSRVKNELTRCLREDGYSNVQEAVGADVFLGTGRKYKGHARSERSKVIVEQQNIVAKVPI